VARPFVALLTLLILLALAISVVNTSIATYLGTAMPALARNHAALCFRGGGVFIVTLPAAGELEGHPAANRIRCTAATTKRLVPLCGPWDLQTALECSANCESAGLLELFSSFMPNQANDASDSTNVRSGG
jgi:hypothetical protein